MAEKLRRHCDACGKNFRPMTDAQWHIVKDEHDSFSLRHRGMPGSVWNEPITGEQP